MKKNFYLLILILIIIPYSSLQAEEVEKYTLNCGVNNYYYYFEKESDKSENTKLKYSLNDSDYFELSLSFNSYNIVGTYSSHKAICFNNNLAIAVLDTFQKNNGMAGSIAYRNSLHPIIIDTNGKIVISPETGGRSISNKIKSSVKTNIKDYLLYTFNDSLIFIYTSSAEANYSRLSPLYNTYELLSDSTNTFYQAKDCENILSLSQIDKDLIQINSNLNEKVEIPSYPQGFGCKGGTNSPKKSEFKIINQANFSIEENKDQSNPSKYPKEEIKINEDNTNTNYIQAIKEIRDKNKYKNVIGKILLKPEDKGRAFYVNPLSQKIFSLGNPKEAFNIIRQESIGISNSNLEKIPLAYIEIDGADNDEDGLIDSFEEAIGSDPNKSDSDGDGYDDKTEIINGYSPLIKGDELNKDNEFINKNLGKIFLQVESKGEAWYINPKDSKRYFLARPEHAYQIMKKLSLGISNKDFDNL